MEAKIVYSCRAAGSFEGIVDGNLADRIRPMRHEEKLTVTILPKLCERLFSRFVNRILRS